MVSPTVGHSLMFRQHRSCGMEGGGGGGGLRCMPTDLCVTYNCYYLTPVMDKKTVNISPYPAGTWIEHSLMQFNYAGEGGGGGGGGCMPPDTCVIAISCMLTQVMDN